MELIDKLREKLIRSIGTDIGGLWHVNARVDKFIEDINEFPSQEEFFSKCKPYDTFHSTQNGLLKVGINNVWSLVCGGTATPYDSANARLGVGDSSDVFSSDDTGLLAPINKEYKGMDVGYPVFGSSQKVVFKSSFGAAEANFDWNEWSVDNGPSGINLNRKVEFLGTKVTGTWVLVVELSLS